MKKRLLGLLLTAVMLVPLLSSCSHEEEPPEEEAPIYTLYTIADATPEAIREVELALNRILFYREGLCLDIVAVSEEKYAELIEDQYTLMEEYTASKKSKKKKNDDSSAEENPADSDTSEIMTGERIIQRLENGEDIVSTEPRLDIFLARSYDEYYNLVKEEKLSPIDEKLTSEAKLLNDYIHSSLFTAAKINKKTYGVPVNTALGSYKYIVFDAELLEKYNFDAKTMIGLEDLEEYLALIKENEPDIIPLKAAPDSSDIPFIFEDGFPAYVDESGVVMPSYENEDLLNHYAMIARYNALGYFTNSGGDNDARFAVTFISGDESSVKELSEKTEREYEYNVYQNPVATNENAIDNIYCISKFCIANELTDVMKILNILYTDSDAQNILTYGIEGTHYVLTDDLENRQVIKLNDDYKINPDYTGNKFIAYTLEGENYEKWDKVKELNLNSTASKSLGFNMERKGIKYTDEDGNEAKIYEPDYKAIIQKVLDNYYPSLLNGTIIDIDIKALKAESKTAVYEEMRENLKEKYQSNISSKHVNDLRKQLLESAQAKQIRDKAEEYIMEDVLKTVKGTLKAELTTKFREELGADATNEDIAAKVDETLTDEYLNEHKYDVQTKEEVDELINEQFENDIAIEVNEKVTEYLQSAAYQSETNRAINSAEFKKELDDDFERNSKDLINENIDSKIAELILENTKKIIEDFNAETETAINEFVEENSEVLDKSKDQILEKLGYLEEEKSDDDEKVTYKEAFESYFDFVFKEKIQDPYYVLYPLPKEA